MVQVPFENELATPVDMHVSGNMVANPAHEDVISSTNLTHGKVTTEGNTCQKAIELAPPPFKEK